MQHPQCANQDVPVLMIGDMERVLELVSQVAYF